MLDAGGFLVVFVATAALTPLFMRRAADWRLLALPDSRKRHSGAIPLVGGLAMGLAFLASYFLAGAVANPTRVADVQSLALAGAVAVALIGGLLDDRHELSARYKFVFQIVAATLVVLWGGAQLTHLGNLMTENLFTLGRWSIPLSIFAIVGVMNAINMSDGLDGLAGSLVLAACIGFGYAAVAAGDGVMFTLVCLIAGAVLGFLVHNARLPGRPAALVYMGDTGSMLLGLLLACLAIRLSMSERPALAPITAVWILGLPIADTVTIMIRRALRGHSPFHADREHVHHILLKLGLTTTGTVITLFAATLAFCSAGLVAERAGVAQHVMFYLYAVFLIGYGVAAELLVRQLGLRQRTEEEHLAEEMDDAETESRPT